jgi:hypothetical protein
MPQRVIDYRFAAPFNPLHSSCFRRAGDAEG